MIRQTMGLTPSWSLAGQRLPNSQFQCHMNPVAPVWSSSQLQSGWPPPQPWGDCHMTDVPRDKDTYKLCTLNAYTLPSPGAVWGMVEHEGIF